MARLESVAKLGYFAADPIAVQAIAGHLRLPEEKPGDCSLLDPCAGEGKAVRQMADALMLPEHRRYAIELDDSRADLVRHNLGEHANVLGPASFFGTNIPGHSFSAIYCNPPFDDRLGGGGREEYDFTNRATRLLAPGGIYVFVLPSTVLGSYSQDKMRAVLDCYFEDAALFRFPDSVRRFHEVVYFGKKRKMELPDDQRWNGYLYGLYSKVGYRDTFANDCPVVGTTDQRWTLPSGYAPHTFKKNQMTDAELEAAVANTPLLRLLADAKAHKLARPPLALDSGHVALLLSSGMLDGVIEPPGEPPHVVRGTSKKIEFLADSEETVNPDNGVITRKDTISQKIVLSVRAVGPDGEIKTFEDGTKAIEPETAEGAEDAA